MEAPRRDKQEKQPMITGLRRPAARPTGLSRPVGANILSPTTGYLGNVGG